MLKTGCFTANQTISLSDLLLDPIEQLLLMPGRSIGRRVVMPSLPAVKAHEIAPEQGIVIDRAPQCDTQCFMPYVSSVTVPVFSARQH